MDDMKDILRYIPSKVIKKVPTREVGRMQKRLDIVTDWQTDSNERPDRLIHTVSARTSTAATTITATVTATTTITATTTTTPWQLPLKGICVIFLFCHV